jgi:carbamoyl-phosphate synthase large subunit
MNILVVPGTTLVATEVCNSLSSVKNVHLHGAGYDLNAAKFYPYESFSYLGPFDPDNSIANLEKIIVNNNINLVYFAHDSWIYQIRNIKLIGNAIVMITNARSIQIASFKSLTYQALSEHLLTPKVYKNLTEVNTWPIFGKPDRGQGSIGAKIINSPTEAKYFLDTDLNFKSDWIFCENLTGPEYTVDCFSDLSHNVIYNSTRLRKSLKNGLAVETFIVSGNISENWAKIISNELKLIGAWFFQIKENQMGKAVLLEVGLRVAGASGIQRLKGVNLPLLTILLFSGEKLKIIKQDVYPKISKSNFEFGFNFQDIYVDYDDTIRLDHSVNHSLIEFLKKSKKESKRLFLLTRHTKNIKDALDKIQISDLFDAVFQLDSSEPKSKYIKTSSKFLFIDDSFKERLDVWNAFGDQVLVLDQTVFQR